MYLSIINKSICNDYHKIICDNKAMKNYSDRLKYALMRNGMTQSELARLVGVKPQAIQYLCEKGKRSVHSVKISEILKITPSWLTDGTGDIETTDSEVIRYPEIPKEEASPLSKAQSKITEALKVLFSTEMEPMDMVMLQQMIGMMAEKYKDQTPEKNQQNENKPLTSPAQNAGGGAEISDSRSQS